MLKTAQGQRRRPAPQNDRKRNAADSDITMGTRTTNNKRGRTDGGRSNMSDRYRGDQTGRQGPPPQYGGVPYGGRHNSTRGSGDHYIPSYGPSGSGRAGNDRRGYDYERDARR